MTEQTETADSPRRHRLRGYLRDAWTRSAGPANLTYRWLISGIALGMFFVGCAVYAAVTAYQTDNRVTDAQIAESIRQQVITCITGNERRADAKILAIASVDADQQGLDSDQKALTSDLASWQSIDELFPDGLPEPTRTVVFTGLADRQISLNMSQVSIDARRGQIDKTYEPVPCDQINKGSVVQDN